jgi:hypothetical protein
MDYESHDGDDTPNINLVTPLRNLELFEMLLCYFPRHSIASRGTHVIELNKLGLTRPFCTVIIILCSSFVSIS